MKKKGLICLIIGILFISIIPIENKQATSSSNILVGDIYIESIEPIQVIIDSDTLVTNKPTVVRIIVHSTFTEEISSEIEITYDFGSKTYLEDGVPWGGVEIAPGINTIYAPGGPAIPAHNSTWGPKVYLKWTHTGLDGLLKAELDPDNKLVETDETNNIKFIDSAIAVASAPMVKILYVPIAFPGDEDWTVSSSTMNTQKKFMLKTYPLAETDLNFQAGSLWRFSISPSGTGDRLINWLFEVVVYPISCSTRIMGFKRVIISWNELLSGSGVAIGMLRNPEIREPVLVSPYMPQNNLVAHELGHTYYLWHPHDLGPPIFTGECYDVDDYEYGETMDVFMSYRDSPTWIDKGRYDGNPKTPMLSGNYYYPGDPEEGIEPKNASLPVSTWNWNLMEQLTTDLPTYSCIMVHGLLRENGTITLNYSWYRIEAIPDAPQQIIKGSQNQRNYFVIFKNDNNQIISSFPFIVSFNYVTHNDKTGLLEVAETDTVPFIFNIKEVEGTRFIEIQDDNGQILAEREVTQNSPMVQIIYPNGGEKFKIGDKINIQWNAQDQDQDTLRYSLAFSNDNGKTWVPIAFETKETSFEWNTYGLSKGKYKIKVIASDGVNIGEDISDEEFTLPKNKEKNQSPFFQALLRLLNQFPLLERLLLYLQ